MAGVNTNLYKVGSWITLKSTEEPYFGIMPGDKVQILSTNRINDGGVVMTQFGSKVRGCAWKCWDIGGITITKEVVKVALP